MTGPIIARHNNTCAVEISASKDGSRISIGVLTRPNASAAWKPSGPMPSVPRVLLADVIAGLHQMQDRLVAAAGGGGR